MINLLVLALAAAPCLASDPTAEKKTKDEPSVWQKVDSSLTEGVQAIKKMLMTDGADAPPKQEKNAHSEKSAARNTESKIEQDLDKATSSLNKTWDGALTGVGIKKAKESSGSGQQR